MLNKIDENDEDDQKLFELEFFTGEKIKSLISMFEILVFQVIIDFLQSDFCKEILEATTLKFILKLVIFTIKISTLTIRFLNSLRINKILQKAI